MSRLESIPEGLRNRVKMMLNSTPELRPDEHEFIKVQVFLFYNNFRTYFKLFLVKFYVIKLYGSFLD